ERVDVTAGGGYVAVRVGTSSQAIGFRGLPADANWRMADHHLILALPVLTSPVRLEISIGPVLDDVGAEYLREHVANTAPVRDLTPLTQPGPGQYEIVQTQAVTGADTGPFAVDVLTLPEDNPWNSFVRLTGVDFLSDGRAVVSSLSGDIWLVSGITEQLGTLGWKRYATGLNQPLGVRVVDDQIYVTGRDQITRLHDRNGDDEADFYEAFNNEIMAGWNYHEFTMHLETDSEGNFYFAKATPWPPYERGRNTEITPHHGVLFRLSPDGSDLQVIATGMRNPNGLAIGPNDEIAYTDQQGHWMPTSPLHLIQDGGFYGFVPSAHLEEAPTSFPNPILWTPQQVDNSPGNPIWITSQTWPEELQGGLMLASYGRANLSLILTETVNGEVQGGHLNLPLTFESGLLRGRFAPDGHLYVNGLTSWQSAGAKPGSFHRVRYTGRSLYLPTALNVKANGIVLRFSDPVDPVTAADPANYEVERWNYRWTSNYGSPLVSVSDPQREGIDSVTVTSVQLGEDGRTVFLELPDMRPVMSMAIRYDLRARDGTEMKHAIHNTIHAVPEEPWR
ncbi:MAG TPA: hypothetical protein VMN39_11905, partial [Longimicrobiaceae bacterium]|nr:hypothetical protein [Longimicrobiaceae bacterium]